MNILWALSSVTWGIIILHLDLSYTSKKTTWRIIPGLVSVLNNHGDRKSPRPGVVEPLPNGLNVV